MAVNVLVAREGEAVMYDTVTSWAFGPVFESESDARDFLRWCGRDPRTISEAALEKVYADWRRREIPMTGGDDDAG